jgi:hypothetical protein
MCGLFNDAFIVEILGSDGRMTNDDLERLLKEDVVAKLRYYPRD